MTNGQAPVALVASWVGRAYAVFAPCDEDRLMRLRGEGARKVGVWVAGSYRSKVLGRSAARKDADDGDLEAHCKGTLPEGSLMDVVNLVAEIRYRVAAWKRQGLRVGLVPTMGNLHDGHLQLVTGMRACADRVLVSIFVNPLQFGVSEDFSAYPRTFESDCEKLSKLGVDAVFAPSTEEVYPDGVPLMTQVSVPALADKLCGEFRPGHFTGVATVVAKLFNLMQPDVAIFGKKDYQQLMIIRRMVRDLNFPVEIVSAPTVRDSDGLAMSSRNGYLSTAERASARVLYAVLRSAAELIRHGERDFASIESKGIDSLNEGGFRPEYLSVRRQLDLATPGPEDRELVVVAAAWIGRTRLIDNIEVEAPAGS